MAGAVVGVGLIVTAFVGVGGGATGHRAAGTDSAVTPGVFNSPMPNASRSIAPRPIPAPSTSLDPPDPPDSPPVELSLPTLAVTAAVQPVVTTGGVLAVPGDPAQVGWWTGSARPGAAAGSVVVDGHVDSAERGIGALYNLTQLESGDTVTITNAAGRRYGYRVYARQVYSKRKPLPASLFTGSGPARLVLITCGGPFDSQTRSYEDNVVVLATPVSV